MPRSDWQTLDNPLHAFKRVAKGAHIAKPKHIFLIVGESIPQWSMDPLYMDFNICPGLRDFAADTHTACVPNFLPVGNVSRPSISSLMSGIYDSGMELNEKEIFWNNTLPTALAAQMKRLGYKTIYWYGGNSSSGNFTKYGKAQGFDRIENATEFCGPQAPQTSITASIGTHLSIMPTIIEAIAPKGFEYYAAEPSEYIRPIDNHARDAEYWRSLSAWMMKFYANVQ